VRKNGNNSLCESSGEIVKEAIASVKIKICGIFRNQDIDYVNEARPDYIGFVFAQSRRNVTVAQAARLRERLAHGITPAGVFVNAPIDEISALYRDGVISLAQLHGNEDETYISRLKEASKKNGVNKGDPVPVIKTIQSGELRRMADCSVEQAIGNQTAGEVMPSNADYFLIDSGAGSGKTFNWNILRSDSPCACRLSAAGKPWFLAGGITQDNIKDAITLNPFCIDISGGAETGGVKDREKILQLTAIIRKENNV
jgi:phosphoribosylanthranilate isomerase